MFCMCALFVGFLVCLFANCLDFGMAFDLLQCFMVLCVLFWGFMVLCCLVVGLMVYGLLFYGFMVLWVCRFVVLWFYDFVVLWFYDFIVLWLYVFKKIPNFQQIDLTSVFYTVFRADSASVIRVPIRPQNLRRQKLGKIARSCAVPSRQFTIYNLQRGDPRL